MRSSKRAARRAGIVKTDGVAKPHNRRSELAREALDRNERVNLNTAIREQARSYIQSVGRLKPVAGCTRPTTARGAACVGWKTAQPFPPQPEPNELAARESHPTAPCPWRERAGAVAKRTRLKQTRRSELAREPVRPTPGHSRASSLLQPCQSGRHRLFSYPRPSAPVAPRRGSGRWPRRLPQAASARPSPA